MKRFLLASLLLASGCVVTPSPVVTPGTVSISAQAVADCTALWRDELGRDITPSERDDCASFVSRGLRSIEDYRTTLRSTAEYADYQRRLEAARTVVLPRLVVSGQYFRLENGQPWTWIGISEFNLLNRFRNGEDIEPVLAQVQALGFNAVRVFTVYDICADGNGCQPIGRSAPTPDLYAAIPAFAQALARHGLYAELVGFTGPYGLLPTDDDKVRHWEALIAAVDGITNVSVELVNEGTHPANSGIPSARLRRPTGILASHGSGQQDETPIQPFWDYATYRPGGGPEHQRKTGHNAWEVAEAFGLPVVSNETTRVPDNEANPDHALDEAAGATLFVAGAVFHPVHGKAGALLEGPEIPMAQAWVTGATSIPLTCQGQPYRHLDDGPYLRVYQRGNDPACIVRIRP